MQQSVALLILRFSTDAIIIFRNNHKSLVVYVLSLKDMCQFAQHMTMTEKNNADVKCELTFHIHIVKVSRTK